MDLDMESDVILDQFPPLEDEDALNGPRYGRQAILDILDSVLDLIPISPRLERLGELLRQNPFEGWAQESHLKVCLVPIDLFMVALIATIHNIPPVFSNESGTLVHLGSNSVYCSSERQGDFAMAEATPCMLYRGSVFVILMRD